jgi:hypothetical protein
MTPALDWFTGAADARAESLRLRRPIFVDVFKDQ